MLEIVEDMHFPANGLGCDNVVTLRHIPGLVDFACVVNLCLDCDPFVLQRGTADASHVFGVVLEVSGVFRRFERDFYLIKVSTKKLLLS